MKRVYQRTMTDCGIACVAMVANVSYKKARAAFKGRRPNKRHGTTTLDLHNALKNLGFKSNKRLSPFKHKEPSDFNTKLIIKESYTKYAKDWHWVVWNPYKKVIWSPTKNIEVWGRLTSYIKISK
jgi:ABC-type bacteriocin/lantibiotic exporter with double-glycine peptidase domain